MSSLEFVDLVDAQSKPFDGLVSVRASNAGETPHECSVLLEATNFKPVDYVFFRRFKDVQGKHLRSSQVLAYVINNSQSRWTEDDLAKCHHDLWLHGVAPLVYVAWPSRIDILSCARKPDFWHVSSNGASVRYKEAARIEATTTELFPALTGRNAISTAADVTDALRRRFSAFRLAEGTFWDDPANQKLAKADAAAHGKLIQAIVEADRDLKGAKHPIRRRLLVLMVLIKYLEDRGVFPARLFGNFHAGAKSFLDILRDGTVMEVRRLLGYLERKFNGDVFSLGADIKNLTRDELTRFAALVGAKNLGGQDHFWELFSFEHVPVEVISRLYQRFVTGHGAVYTPPFLAALLLDQVMPYERLTGKEKVVDPACGSGIFLVGAFKRLVAYWRSRNGWAQPTVQNLKEILSSSIYGVELEGPAVDLTAFSLALAICDALPPPVIWSNLKFDKLRGRNLRHGDYFDPATFNGPSGHAWPEKFNVVIGNPPFQSELTDPAKDVDNERSKVRPPLPDKQLAYLFLEQAMRSLTLGGLLCLIQPHGILYNSQTKDFRRYLMKSCRLDTILDFVSLRGLYEGADPKTIAWHAVYEPLNDKSITHLTFRRTYSTAERIGFEIDHYDWHRVSIDAALNDSVIWRGNLLGGGRLGEISNRLRKMTTLKDAVALRNWVYSEGFNIGSKGRPSSYLTNQPYLPTEALTEMGIDESCITKLREKTFEAARVKELYDPPLVLLKENVSLPIAFWNRSNLTYRHSIVGIHAPDGDEAKLRNFYNEIKKNRRLYQFCFLLIGTRTLTGKATAINKHDIDHLPFPDDPSELSLAFWEEALKEDVLNYVSDYVRLGQDSDLLVKTAGTNELRAYSSLYVKMLGSLYQELKAHEPVFLNGLIAQPFYFGTKPDVSWLGQHSEQSLHKLIYDQSRESLRTLRVVRHYEGNVILIVKPDRLRYWIRSTAIWDADETLTNLREQGW